jgi:hypothetical protein
MKGYTSKETSLQRVVNLHGAQCNTTWYSRKFFGSTVYHKLTAFKHFNFAPLQVYNN